MPAPSPVSFSAPRAPRWSRLLEDLDALPDDLVGPDVVEIGDEPDATGVVLEAGIVESRPRPRLVHREVLWRPCGRKTTPASRSRPRARGEASKIGNTPGRVKRRTDASHSWSPFTRVGPSPGSGCDGLRPQRLRRALPVERREGQAPAHRQGGRRVTDPIAADLVVEPSRHGEASRRRCAAAPPPRARPRASRPDARGSVPRTPAPSPGGARRGSRGAPGRPGRGWSRAAAGRCAARSGRYPWTPGAYTCFVSPIQNSSTRLTWLPAATVALLDDRRRTEVIGADLARDLRRALALENEEARGGAALGVALLEELRPHDTPGVGHQRSRGTARRGPGHLPGSPG